MNIIFTTFANSRYIMLNTVKIIVLLIGFVLLFQFCGQTSKPELAISPTYIGTEKCQNCHINEFKSYLTSTHFHALDTISSLTVKADFNNTFFVYFGDTTFFYIIDNQYFVHTTDSTGHKKEFRISYTIGWSPLQQYLVAFPDGKLQTLPFCWDTRPKEKGGQRWFHIYDKEKIPPGDELFWMEINMNWNNMCADCHTTGYFKNYNIEKNTFRSKWIEDRVSCESCHGPASNHVAWTVNKEVSDSLKGFEVNLSVEKVKWVMNSEKGIAYPDKVIHNHAQIETCARCHARAARLSDDYHHGQSLLQTHIPSIISSDNYYIDGQIKNEDYEYGSFLQSKMYAAGVTCTNCHDPHTSKLKAEGNIVCSSCHSTAKFDGPQHTNHSQNSSGSECVNCHMPATNYMVIDERRDHSIRIPRPDLSEQLGTPNACNKCHSDKSVKWAAKQFIEWYGTKLSTKKTYGELLHNISSNASNSENDWNELMIGNFPDIIKATALAQNNRFYSPQSIQQIKNQLLNNDPLMRQNAVAATSGLSFEILKAMLIPLIYDSILIVRTDALKNLAPFYQQLDEKDRHRFDVVLFECLTLERNMSDRPEGYLNQGNILTSIRRFDEAEKIYLLGLQRYPLFIGLYLNLADHYRARNMNAQSKEYLEKGLVIQPFNANLHFSLGLWHIRNKDKKAALIEISSAVKLNPSDYYSTYVYALVLEENGQAKKGIEILKKYIAQYGNNPMILDALHSMNQNIH